MFLDNVTTILLLTPIIIRICEVADLNPPPVIIIVIMSCNIAGAGTPMGDPPNIMILSNEYLVKKVDLNQRQKLRMKSTLFYIVIN